MGDEFPSRESEERFREEQPEAYMRRREFLTRTAALAGLAGLASVLPAEALIRRAAGVQASSPFPSPANMPIDTFVVLMMENRSFDHYLSWFPGADGKAQQLSYPQANGGPPLHPTHWAPDFQGCAHVDPDHSWGGGRIEWDQGALDGFLVAEATAAFPGGDPYAIGYYLKEDLPFTPHVAEAFTLYDRYFASLLGPTFSNRYYQWAAQSGGQAHNNIPPKPNTTGAEFETIFDRAIAQGLTARYYASDQPFALLFGARATDWIHPVADFYADAEAGNLPNIAFVDPPFLDGGGGDGLSGDEHPHGDIRIGQSFQSDITHAFLSSPQYRHGAMFINYDEWGGFFDHVAPRVVPDDRENQLPIDATAQEIALSPPDFGITGFRIPGVAISPYARRGYVSHATVTHESILKLIAYRFGLGYLNKRHRYASNIGMTFDWENPKFDVPDLPSPLPPVTTPCSLQTGASSPAQAGASSPAQGAETEQRAQARAEREEGPELGSPQWYDYVETLGYRVQAPTVDRIFRHPGRIDPAFRQLWNAKARSLGS